MKPPMQHFALFKALVDGATIVMKEPAVQGKATFTVVLPDPDSTRPPQYIGRITAGQFDKLCSHGLLKSLYNTTKDKYGNFCHRFVLYRPYCTKTENLPIENP